MDQAWHAWVNPRPIESMDSVNNILFTHFHADHFHPESFPLLNRDADVLVPATAGNYLCNKARESGFTKTREIHAGQPVRMGELEVHALRIHDHWEFLDETAYLIAENDTAALFLADLWYMPPSLLARWKDRYRLAFASIPWGGSLENLCELPEGYELGSFEEYFRYGMDENSLARRNAVMEHGGVMSTASVIDADYMIPGSFGFGWIAPGDGFVKPMPVNQGLDQDAFIASMPDARIKSKLHSMYPGYCYDTDSQMMHCEDTVKPNHRVTPEMRARSHLPRNSSIRLDTEHICRNFLTKIDSALARIRGASPFYQDRMCHLLSGESQFEIHVVNEARQMFLFEQKRDRFALRAIDRPTGLDDIVYMPPLVLNSLVDDWGPKWTDANFSGLVKVSANGWAPYKHLPIYFG